MDQTQKLKGTAKCWDMMKVDYNHLRLISVNYYDKVWVPVLALDISRLSEQEGQFFRFHFFKTFLIILFFCF